LAASPRFSQILTGRTLDKVCLYSHEQKAGIANRWWRYLNSVARRHRAVPLYFEIANETALY